MIGIRCERGSHQASRSIGSGLRIPKASRSSWNSPMKSVSIWICWCANTARCYARAAPDGPSGNGRGTRRPVTAPALGGIDLHPPYHRLDGRCTPQELVQRAVRAGHRSRITTRQPRSRKWTRKRGTTASTLSPVLRLPRWRQAVTFTCLATFRSAAPGLASLLVRQRAARVARIERIAPPRRPWRPDRRRTDARAEPAGERPIDWPAASGAAMVEAGHVASTQEAFDRWLGPTAQASRRVKAQPGSGHRDHSPRWRDRVDRPSRTAGFAPEFQRLPLPVSTQWKHFIRITTPPRSGIRRRCAPSAPADWGARTFGDPGHG